MTDKIRFRVSNVCGTCHRNIYLFACGAPREDFSIGIKAAFAAGHEAEPKIVQWAAESLEDGPFAIGYSYGDIGLIETEHAEIEGHVDGLMRSVSTGEAYLLEVKNLAPNRLTELRKSGLKCAEPSYYNQIQLYMYGLILKGWGYTKTIWIARNNKYRKDDDPQKYYVERVDYDRERVVELLDKAEIIAKAVLDKEEIAPDLDPTKNFFCQAGWCQFSKNCHEWWNRNNFMKGVER